jgi:hypothetical protein
MGNADGQIGAFVSWKADAQLRRNMRLNPAGKPGKATGHPDFPQRRATDGCLTDNAS